MTSAPMSTVARMSARTLVKQAIGRDDRPLVLPPTRVCKHRSHELVSTLVIRYCFREPSSRR